MINLAGSPAIDFTADAVMPGNEIVNNFNLSSYAEGKKVVILFYPLNFTFVCPSELIATHNRIADFTERSTKVIFVSVDSVYSHLAWQAIPPNKGGIGNMQYVMVSDLNKEISQAYGVLCKDGVAMRGTIIIDGSFTVRHYSVNDLPIGRNIEDYLRVLDAIDYHAQHGDACPAGWNRGKEGMKQTQEGVSNYLTSNADTL